MSKLAALDGLLELYYQLNYHKNPEIYQRLQDVQAWQKLRMQRTHARHFAEKQNALMAEYFLNRLYGGPDFDALAQQIARQISSNRLPLAVQRAAPAAAAAPAAE